jgi:hypothetical protein
MRRSAPVSRPVPRWPWKWPRRCCIWRQPTTISIRPIRRWRSVARPGPAARTCAGSGQPPEPLEPWMEELYRRVSDRQTMGSVVDELRTTLGRSKNRSTSFSATRKNVHHCTRCPASWRRCAACFRCSDWTRLHWPRGACVTASSNSWSTRCRTAAPRCSRNWATAWVRWVS